MDGYEINLDTIIPKRNDKVVALIGLGGTIGMIAVFFYGSFLYKILALAMLYYFIRMTYQVLTRQSQSVIFREDGLHLSIQSKDYFIPKNEITDTGFGDALLPYYFPLNLFGLVYPAPGIFIQFQNPQSHALPIRGDAQFSVMTLVTNKEAPFRLFIHTGIKTVVKSLEYKIQDEFALVQKNLAEKAKWDIHLLDDKVKTK